MDDDCDNPNRGPNSLCVADLRYAGKPDKDILRGKPDAQLYLPFGFYGFSQEELYQPGYYGAYISKIYLFSYIY